MWKISASVPIFNPSHRIVSHISTHGQLIWSTPEPPAGEGAVDVATIYEDYEATSDNYIILADASWGNITITLPPLAGVDGMELHVKKIDSTANTVTVDAFYDELIENNETYVLSDEDEVVSIVADADAPEWQILNVLT